LRTPGSNVRTETFSDGSTRTTVVRDDGTQVVTIRDASGRVVRRAAYDQAGHETTLINDTIPETKVDVKKLPKAGSEAASHRYSLRQIRTIPAVKDLAPVLKIDSVTFNSGSAAITPSEAEKLADLAKEVKRRIAKNPNKVFLIEGHTDAVGTAASNLTLSDRRAESVAKALIEYYGVSPENLVVQGYGESELLIDTQTGERANRRVVVRDVTPILKTGK
jgi:outer membrane protein OmpA-like peptidoglycan-associated protein